MGSGAGVMADDASSESSKTSRNSASMPPNEDPANLEVLTLQVCQMSGKELDPVRIVAKETVSFLCREVLQQLSVQRISLLHDGKLLPMQETVGSCLKDGDVVNVLVRPNALLLQQVDLDTGLETQLLDGARWKGETLVLGRVLSCASPGWDVVPDMETNFAVEATVKLNVWPQPDWRGSVISQHGSGTGWELRLGGPGVTALFTTDSHNELMLPWKLPDTGVWHHFCMIYDATTRRLSVVRDGTERKERRVSGAFRPHEEETVLIGRNPDWPDRGIIGEIRNAAVWPKGFDFGLEDLPDRAAARVEEAKASEERESNSGSA